MAWVCLHCYATWQPHTRLHSGWLHAWLRMVSTPSKHCLTKRASVLQNVLESTNLWKEPHKICGNPIHAPPKEGHYHRCLIAELGSSVPGSYSSGQVHSMIVCRNNYFFFECCPCRCSTLDISVFQCCGSEIFAEVPVQAALAQRVSCGTIGAWTAPCMTQPLQFLLSCPRHETEHCTAIPDRIRNTI